MEQIIVNAIGDACPIPVVAAMKKSQALACDFFCRYCCRTHVCVH